MKRRIQKLIYKQTFVLILLQLGFMFVFFYGLSNHYVEFKIFLEILNLIVLFYVINRQDNPSYKLVWCVVILIFPFVGGILYMMFGGRRIPKALRSDAMESTRKSKQYLDPHQEVMDELFTQDVHIARQFNYIFRSSRYPVYRNTKVDFFKSGEEKFATLIQKLNHAKHTIYLEYFIIDEGKMWNTILAILKEKVKQDVDVRIIFDSAGCFETLPPHYDLFLNKEGIQCKVFNPLRPQLLISMNNRDHRKIAVIDNEIAFTGGINLADEYINELDRFGHWKDTAIMLEGEAVWNFTIMFLQFWNFLSEEKITYKKQEKILSYHDEGYVLPFSDSPTDSYDVGLNVHLNMIQNAKFTCYIQTPYLIISYQMKQALCNAAISGVDVRIVVPHHPDKWYAHMMTQGSYRALIEAGVKIYEYLPGFIHSKTILVDHEFGLCGTINMDWRSYYMHYEDAVLMYRCKALQRMVEDYQETLDLSKLMTIEDCNQVKLPMRLFHTIMNLFSPLM